MSNEKLIDYRPSQITFTTSIRTAKQSPCVEPGDHTVPEHELLRGVLRQAIMDIAHVNHCKGERPEYIRAVKRIRNDALEWVFDEPNATREWSFEWVCEHLEVEPNHIRSALKQLVETGVHFEFRYRQRQDPMYKAA